MSRLRRVRVSLPAALVEAVDREAAATGASRSEWIRQAMEFYLGQQRRLALRQRLIEGYQEMAGLNQQLAEEGDWPLREWECRLAEAE